MPITALKFTLEQQAEFPGALQILILLQGTIVGRDGVPRYRKRVIEADGIYVPCGFRTLVSDLFFGMPENRN